MSDQTSSFLTAIMMVSAVTRCRIADSPASLTGGEKGLWVSRAQKSDTVLVIAESALDALSYAALYPDDGTRYASVGGTLNTTQPALIRSAIERLQAGSVLRIVTDNDGDGATMGNEIAREDLAVEFSVPSGAKDWNDVLRRQLEVAPTHVT